MREKYLVAYCSNCREKTKHKKICCNESPLERTWFAFVTLGMSEVIGHNYQCECVNCGKIRTIER